MSRFTTSTLSIHGNAIKNILFRVATLLIQLAVYKLLSYVAFKSKAYTSFLMFAESIMQKLLFISSCTFTRQAFIVLAFTILFTTAGFYDTLLWALDAPGFVFKSSTTDASAVAQELLSNPAYISFVSDVVGNVDEAIGANLFKPGFNFTFPAPVDLGTRTVVPESQPFSEAGPRIWLDDAGFSVGVDQTAMTTYTFLCPTETVDANQQVWECHMNNTEAQKFLENPTGRPQIWWDNVTESMFLLPNRMDNPWQSLGIGGDTAVMKQVFTVTKDSRRHTFLETAFKVSMVTLYPTPFSDVDITDMVRRTWSNNGSQPITPIIQLIANKIISSQTNQTSFILGFLHQDVYSVYSSSIELLNVVNPGDITERLYSVLRITSTNITLMRSDTLHDPIVPFTPCPYSFSNLATGGRVRSTTCSTAVANQTGAHFLGQLDASSVLILSEVLGDGKTSTSATALNQTGLDWYLRNSERMDQLLTSRGFILGGDRAAVHVGVQRTEAALSYLQLLLVILPALFALIAWILIIREPMGYYKNSFLAAVCATTHVGSDSTCRQVGYLRAPPEIMLSTIGEHVLIGMQSGVLANVGVEQAIAYVEPSSDKETVVTNNSEDQTTLPERYPLNAV